VTDYLSRIVDKELGIALRSSGAVLIEGAKWCGKTRTAEQQAASALYLQDIDKKDYYARTLDTKPSILLEGETPRLIDEWQDAPMLWDGVRFIVDQRRKVGQFILTGSAVPADGATMHTGTGRISRILMRPMTLFESLESNGSVSLNSLFNGKEIEGTSSLTLEKLAFALVRGGWPASVGEDDPIALRHARSYVDSVTNNDLSRVDGVVKNPAKIFNLLQSLARNISTTAKMKTIMDDMNSGDDGGITDKTFSSYTNALRRIFVTEDLPAWGPSMRSKSALRTSAKRHFTDPSIAAAVLRTSPEGLMKDFNTFGLLFESLVIRDLRVYAQANDGRVFHFRDKYGLEADAIVQLYDGRWGAVEVKMGSRETEKAVDNLIKLKDKVDLEKMGEPSFLAVITATEYAHSYKDGVSIVPIGCLRD
jgi:predicted AAA+ superfamily ATPase